MNMNTSLKLFAISWFVLAPVFARADIQPAPLFADHMVLQRNMPIAIWGKAAPGEKVSAALAGKSAETTAEANGRWMLKLEALPAGAARAFAAWQQSDRHQGCADRRSVDR